jgi:hypothetical protein
VLGDVLYVSNLDESLRYHLLRHAFRGMNSMLKQAMKHNIFIDSSEICIFMQNIFIMTLKNAYLFHSFEEVPHECVLGNGTYILLR